MISTGNDEYDRILARAQELQEAQRAANPDPLPYPANFSIDLGAMRMTVTFEPAGRTSQKTAA
jgi:hypothetical protein